MIPRQKISQRVRRIITLLLPLTSMETKAYSTSTPVYTSPTLLPQHIHAQIRPLPKYDYRNTDNKVDQITISVRPTSTRKVSYDLGIHRSLSTDMVEVALATKYLIEHESVNEYPSPRQHVDPPVEVAAAATTTTVPNRKSTRQHPPLIPRRVTNDDMLKIVQHGGRNHHEKEDQRSQIAKSNTIDSVQVFAHPKMRSGQDFDINTAWIELLIHEQQMKLLQQQQHEEQAVSNAKPAYA